MGLHSTNYKNTFILVAPDCTTTEGKTPPESSTVAARSFRMIQEAPYTYTSDEVIFGVFADRKDIPKRQRTAARNEFFSKGQACLRASALGKTYGWGVHFDSLCRVALYGCESSEYQELAGGRDPEGTAVTVKTAMRSRR